jgi:hypothetical protein
MGLFRKSPPPRPTLQRRVPRPRDPPESEFPAIVPIDTCRWPVYGIAETRVAIDAQLILDAAQRSIPLWPENDG